MAYNNEFPHFEANKLNLNWLLDQYATFNDRIAEIQQSFNVAVQQFEDDLQDFETDVNTAISNFETNVNDIISEFQASTNDEISEFETTVTNEINSLTTNMITYVSEHMDEWQAEASYNNNLLRLSSYSSPLLDYTESIERVVTGNKVHDIRLAPPQYYLNNEMATAWDSSTGVYTFANKLHTEGKGVYLVIASANVSFTTNENSLTIGATLISSDNTKGDLLFPITQVESVTPINNQATKRFNFVCVFESSERVDIDLSATFSETGSYNGCAFSGIVYKLSDEI